MADSREARARKMLNSGRLWLILPYFVLVAVVVVLYVQEGRISDAVQRANRADTVRIAEARSSYTQCVHSIPTLKRVNRFVNGVRELDAVLVENAQATHEATLPGSATYAAQTKNLARLRASAAKVSGIAFPVPTVSECATELAHALSP